MPRLIESIKVQNGVLHNLSYHEQRMRRACAALWGQTLTFDLSKTVSVPLEAQSGLFKCRILYHQTIDSITFTPYHWQPITSLRRVYCNHIDYAHKYENRDLLQQLAAQRGECDDVLIIKDGLVTDTSYANIAFSDGHRWYTPAHPLLPGTQRQRLLDQELIIETVIPEQDLTRYRYFQVINAFHALGDSISSTEDIR